MNKNTEYYVDYLKNDLTDISKIFKRFIKYVEIDRIFDSEPQDISVSEYNQLDPNEEFIKTVDLEICRSLFEIVVSKVKMMTLVDISDENNPTFVDFKTIFEVFKHSMEECEIIFANEGKNIYDLQFFDVVIIISDKMAVVIVENHVISKFIN